MSIVTLGQFYGGPGSPTKVDFWLDGSGDKVAAKKVASEAKQITHIVVRVDAITGTPPTYAARLETISSFVPSGTLVAAGASGTFTPAAANTVHEIALSTPWTPSINDEFAVVIEYSSGTINSSNRAEITYRATMFHSLGNGEAPFTNSGSGYSQVDGTLALLGVKYSDGTYMRCSGCLEGSSPTGTSDFDDGTNPDERGVVWTQPYTVDCVGAALETRIFSGGTGDIRLYEDSTQLASVSFDQDRLEGNAATDLVVGYWAAQTLTKDSTYRIALKATHATNNVRQLRFQFHEEEARKAFFPLYYGTHRNNGGSWTDEVTWGIPGTFAMIDASSVPTGGGSTTNIITRRSTHHHDRRHYPRRKRGLVTIPGGSVETFVPIRKVRRKMQPAADRIRSRTRIIPEPGGASNVFLPIRRNRNRWLPAAIKTRDRVKILPGVSVQNNVYVPVSKKPRSFVYQNRTIRRPKQMIVNQTVTQTVVISKHRKIV